MSGQYKIMYSSMDQFYDQTNGRMAEWVSQLEPWVKACENLGNMECYQGKSAESVKTYLKEVHMTLLTSIQQAIQLYRTKYLFYREGYYDMEGDLYAVIPQKTLLSVKDRMKTEIEDVSDSSLIVQTSLLNVSDLIALQAPNSYYLKDSMEEVKQNVTDFNQNIIDYEAQHKSEANGGIGRSASVIICNAYRILYKRNECDIVSVGRLFRKFTYAGALSACTDSE